MSAYLDLDNLDWSNYRQVLGTFLKIGSGFSLREAAADRLRSEFQCRLLKRGLTIIQSQGSERWKYALCSDHGDVDYEETKDPSWFLCRDHDLTEADGYDPVERCP